MDIRRLEKILHIVAEKLESNGQKISKGIIIRL